MAKNAPRQTEELIISNDEEILVPDSGDIEVIDGEPAEDVIPDTDAIPVENVPSKTSLAKAVQVFDGHVINIVRIVIDEDGKPVSFEVPYGSELFVVEENDTHNIGDPFVQVD